MFEFTPIERFTSDFWNGINDPNNNNGWVWWSADNLNLPYDINRPNTHVIPGSDKHVETECVFAYKDLSDENKRVVVLLSFWLTNSEGNDTAQGYQIVFNGDADVINYFNDNIAPDTQVNLHSKTVGLDETVNSEMFDIRVNFVYYERVSDSYVVSGAHCLYKVSSTFPNFPMWIRDI